MAGVFPILANDELFYSGVGRLWDALGRCSQRKLFEESFSGRRPGYLSFDLPIGLDGWAAWLPPGSPYAAKVILEAHTLFPYYAALSEPNTISAVRATMLGEKKGRERVHARLGLLPAGNAWRCGLRYCVRCARRDSDVFGVAIWRRLHQLPGVLVCLEHDQPLCVEPFDRARRALTLPQSAGGRVSSAIAIRPGAGEILARLASASQWLLAHGVSLEVWAEHPSVRHERLMLALKQTGWARPNGILRLRRLHAHLRSRVGETTLEILGCPLESVERNSWLRRLLHRPTSAQVPIYWLLLLETTGIPPEAVLCPSTLVHENGMELQSEKKEGQIKVLTNPKIDTPKGWERVSAPADAPCRNAACAEFLRNADARLLKASPASGRYLVDCSSCGFAYFWNPEHPSWRRIFQTGWAWDAILRAMAAKPGCTVAEISRRLSVDPLTVRRHAARLGITPQAWGKIPLKTGHSGRRQRALATNRKKFAAIRVLNPHLSRTQLLQGPHKSVCEFLRRYDRNWLEQHMPAVQTGSALSRQPRRRERMRACALASTVDRIFVSLRSRIADGEDINSPIVSSMGNGIQDESSPTNSKTSASAN
jgi:hypothetical protein